MTRDKVLMVAGVSILFSSSPPPHLLAHRPWKSRKLEAWPSVGAQWESDFRSITSTIWCFFSSLSACISFWGPLAFSFFLSPFFDILFPYQPFSFYLLFSISIYLRSLSLFFLCRNHLKRHLYLKKLFQE